MLHWIPVDEAFDGEPVECAECGATLVDAYPAKGEYYCEPCVTQLAEAVAEEARAYAEGHCRITRRLPRYDPALEFKCSPEEYAAGERETYSRNAHTCHCRHACTNYDELIRGLDRDCNLDRVEYEAIRDRIDELVADALEELEMNDLEEEDLEEDG